MSSPTQIVFCVDFSDMTDAVIGAALQAQKQNASAELHGVCVLEPSRSPLAAKDWQQHELDEVEKALGARIASVTDASVKCHVLVGNVASEICDLTSSLKAELIVVGRHGQSASEPHVIGSAAMRLLQLAPCSVLVVQPANYR